MQLCTLQSFSCDGSGSGSYIMPKEFRAPTNVYRLAPVALPSDVSSGTRVTSIWTQEEDETLMSARAKGLSWAPIASQYFPTKTANACRKRHERLMDRRSAEEWDTIKLETLAREYMAVRREMWSLLADRVGEKWQTIEAKCMEKGFKNLQAVHRSAQRKQRGMGEFDSGILMDAEGEIDDDAGLGSSNALPASFRLDDRSLQRGGNMSIQAMLSPSPPSPPTSNASNSPPTG